MLCAIHAVVGLGAYYRNLICDCKSSDLLVFRQNYQTSFCTYWHSQHRFAKYELTNFSRRGERYKEWGVRREECPAVNNSESAPRPLRLCVREFFTQNWKSLSELVRGKQYTECTESLRSVVTSRRRHRLSQTVLFILTQSRKVSQSFRARPRATNMSLCSFVKIRVQIS